MNKTLISSFVAFSLAFAPVATLAAPAPTPTIKTIKKSVRAVKKPVAKTAVKNVVKIAAKKAPTTTVAVAEVAKGATTVPTKAYIQALKNAMDKYLNAKSRAKGSKVKLEVAEKAYSQAVEDANGLLITL